ncbi:MAG: helix-turn-helix domain-containing protein, partial [Sphingomonadaceae bacterium]
MAEDNEEIFTEERPIGERLRSAREAAGIELEQIAAETRVPIRHLANIEEENWEALPAATYTIGFAKNYARKVGLDEREIAEELRARLDTEPPQPIAYEPFEPADSSRVPPMSLAMIAGAVAVVLVVIYLVWRSGLDGEDEPATRIAEAERVEAGEVPPLPEEVAQPETGPPAAAAASGPVVLTATDEVWIRVYERDGERLFEQLMQAGGRYQIPATAQEPLILTGRPQALRITVGGFEIPPLGGPEQTISDVSLAPADLLA